MTIRDTVKPHAPMRDFAHSLPMALLKAREAAMARFRPMLKEHGLTEQQWRVIRVLSAFDQIDASELARRSLLLAPSLTRILRFLEKVRILRRCSDSRDQRRSVFSLSAKGQRLYAEVGPHSEALYARIEKRFGAGKLVSLYSLLDEFSAALKT